MAKRYFPLNRILLIVLEKILNSNRKIKYMIAFTIDSCFLYLSLLLAFYLRLGNLNFSLKLYDHIFVSSIIIFLSFWFLLKIYRHILRSSGSATYITFLRFIFFYALIYIATTFIFRFEGVPRTVSIIQPFILYFALIGWRYIFKTSLNSLIRSDRSSYLFNVLVFSNIDFANQAVKALETSENYKVINIINDKKSNDGQYIDNIKVINIDKIKTILSKQNIDLIFFIDKGIDNLNKIEIVKKLELSKVPIKIISNFDQYLTNFLDQNNEDDSYIENLLERETVFDLNKNVKNSLNEIILITGAGGSIGQELVVQLLHKNVRKLILLDQSEYGLYQTLERVNNFKKINKNLNSIVEVVLGSITSSFFVRETISKFKPTLVYHAAAYKHVPMVEENPIQSYINNVIGTKMLLDFCYKFNIKKFVLISSDKAVRPANIMGKTKRVSELIVQAYSRRNKNIKYMIVRFGNVLNSSGSVIPKFKSQIKAGGPVTVTHPDVTRYFMTISEAVDLVIAASIIGKGKEVFILDMGSPVKIFELAKKIIEIETKFTKRPIQIKFTGLRPGEKMFEELSISGKTIKTKIPKLMKVEEPFLDYENLIIKLNQIELNLKIDKVKKFKVELNKLIKIC